MEIEIRRLTHKDIGYFSELITVFAIVFEWVNILFPPKPHLQKMLDNNHFLVFVAIIDKKLVGGLTAHVLDRYDTEKPSAYLYDIAVLVDFQKKGIGRLLISYLNDYCEKNGFSEVFVQAETDDIQAVNFYKTTPISVELKATHFTYLFDKRGKKRKTNC